MCKGEMASSHRSNVPPETHTPLANERTSTAPTPRAEEASSTSDTIEDVKAVFQEAIIENLDIPSFRTDVGNNTHFRFNLDNCLSILKDTHSSYLSYQLQEASRKGGVTAERVKKQGSDILSSMMERTIKACQRFKDEQLGTIFSQYALVQSPRSAWWSCSSGDWIGEIPVDCFSFLPLVQNPDPKWKAPYIPVAAVYAEALILRQVAENDNDHLMPETATYAAKIAKHLYLTMLEGMRLCGGAGEGTKARIKQCEKKLRIVVQTLDESVGEGEDFLEVLLGNIGPVGPDGQKIDMKTLKKALGVTLQTDQLHQLFSIIPSMMQNSNDPEAAREALMKQPLVKEMMKNGGADADKFMSLFQGLGIVNPLSSAAPLTPGASPQTGSGGPIPSVSKVKVRGSMRS